MTSLDEGNEEGITFACQLCGDSGWLVRGGKYAERKASECCVCEAGRTLAVLLAARSQDAQPARLPAI